MWVLWRNANNLSSCRCHTFTRSDSQLPSGFCCWLHWARVSWKLGGLSLNFWRDFLAPVQANLQLGLRGDAGDGSCHGCTGHCLPFLSLFCSACMSLSIRHRLSLYCSLRQGYYIQSSWGIVSTNQQVAILYLSFVEVREARLHTYWNVWVRHRIFCSLYVFVFVFKLFSVTKL